MIKQLLEEVRAAPLDDASRNRLRDIHQTSIRELESGLAPQLREELERLALPFSDEVTPSDAGCGSRRHSSSAGSRVVPRDSDGVVRAAMAARAQLEQMRQGRCRRVWGAGRAGARRHDSTGQYLWDRAGRTGGGRFACR